MRKYVFGIQVESSKQLKSISQDIKAFMEEVGTGTAEIQVAVGGVEEEDVVIEGFTKEQMEELYGEIQVESEEDEANE